MQSSGALRAMASWPSGKARVCKTLITGSNPVDASVGSRSWLVGTGAAQWNGGKSGVATLS